MDSDNLEKMLDDISDKDVALSYKDYTSIMDAVDALLNKKVESIIINESYLGVLRIWMVMRILKAESDVYTARSILHR